MRWLAFFIFAWLSSSVPALADKRIALIIANSNYQHAPLLNNPRNDAEAVALMLKTIGFASDDVTINFDLGYDAMRKAILTFGREARGASVAIVYFAGHGFGSGVNYLIPVDADLKAAADLPNEAISQRSLEEAVEPAKGLKLVIIDACRSDPSRGRMIDLPARRSVSRGLERVEPDAGVLVLYSAKHGTVAQDGPSGGNSPFAAALVRKLPVPGKEIRFAVGAVRDTVMAATGGEQEPYLYGSLGEEQLFLVPPGHPDPVATASDINSLQIQMRLKALEEEIKRQKEAVHPQNVCGWYAIHYCSKSYDVTVNEARKFAGYVIDTNDRIYPNFARGWYCSVLGPMTREAADTIATRAKGTGFPTAYIKNPC